MQNETTQLQDGADRTAILNAAFVLMTAERDRIAKACENGQCPDCGSTDMKLRSRDPCEGDYYWCDKCGCGPVMYPLNHVMKKTVAVVF